MRRTFTNEGSVLIQVLLVMVILTFLGLALLFVTDIENQLGTTEQYFARTYYAAESGLHAALGGMMATQDWGGEEFAVVERDIAGGRKFGIRVRTSRVQAVGAPEVPPFTIANEGENEFFTYSVIVRSTAQQVSWPADDPVPFYAEGSPDEADVFVVSETDLSVRYMLSPIRQPATPEQPYNASSPVSF